MKSHLTKAVYGRVDKTENNLMIQLDYEMPAVGCTWTSEKELRGPLKTVSHAMALCTAPGYFFFLPEVDGSLATSLSKPWIANPSLLSGISFLLTAEHLTHPDSPQYWAAFQTLDSELLPQQ